MYIEPKPSGSFLFQINPWYVVRVNGTRRHQSSSAVRYVVFRTSAVNLRDVQRLDSENDDDSKTNRVTTLQDERQWPAQRTELWKRGVGWMSAVNSPSRSSAQSGPRKSGTQPVSRFVVLQDFAEAGPGSFTSMMMWR